MPTRKARSEQLRDRLRTVQAELTAAEDDEHAQVLRMLAERRRAYIAAQAEWESVVKEVFAMPRERRPSTADMCAATGLTRQGLERIRAKPS